MGFVPIEVCGYLADLVLGLTIEVEDRNVVHTNGVRQSLEQKVGLNRGRPFLAARVIQLGEVRLRGVGRRVPSGVTVHRSRGAGFLSLFAPSPRATRSL